MGLSKIENEDFFAVASKLGVSADEVRKVCYSFFDSIIRYSKYLPFNDERRIYTKNGFDQFVNVWNVPFIGRIGPVYSRYLKWRANESKHILQESRRNCRTRISQDEIETMAGDILSGISPSPVKKRKISELYNRVWLVDKGCKKLARQVIPKNK